MLPTRFQIIWFQRRRLKSEKLTDDRRRTTSDTNENRKNDIQRIKWVHSILCQRRMPQYS
jgi:hypothetical protein